MASLTPRANHPACLEIEKLMESCAISFQRRSGPGGQNKNKVETAVILEHRGTGLRAEANESRSQQHNRQEAIKRLRRKLALKVRLQVDVDQPPSPLWNSRLKGGKIRVNPDHEDYPCLLAEALDHLEAVGYDVKTAAEVLGCSTSQLIKFLKDEPQALRWVNQQRSDRGLSTYR